MNAAFEIARLDTNHVVFDVTVLRQTSKDGHGYTKRSTMGAKSLH
jgi:hypothetical protein